MKTKSLNKKRTNDTNRKEDLKEARQTLYEVLIGIFVILMSECLIGVFIADNLFSFVAGAVIGAASAAFFYIHLFFILDKALDKPEKEAVRYSKKHTVIRLVLMGVVIVIAFTFADKISVVMTFIGMMNVKFAAYLQPMTHKCINKFRKGR